jgi:hypothetical protein
VKTIKKVLIKFKHVEYVPEKELMEENTLYISSKYKTVIHLCLCGCNNQVVTPLIENAWTLIEKNNKVSMSPSIASYQTCGAHYVIRNSIANFI